LDALAPDIQFFREMVGPTVDEFMADKSNLRRGLLACLLIAAMTEHYFEAHPEIGGLKQDYKSRLHDPA
jgi:hypothetical protein